MIDKPANTESKTLASGQVGWYWRPSSKDRKKKCPMKAASLGGDQLYAFKMASELNQKLADWRSGIKTLVGDEGTMRWLLDGFLDHRLTKSITPHLQKEYARYAGYVCSLKLKGGKTFGQKVTDTVSAKMADNLYTKIEEKYSTSTANRTLKMLRLAWDRQYILYENIIPESNPFSKIETNSHKAKETIPATYEQLQSFVSTAIAMEEVALAFAARACWDMHIRPTELFRSTQWDHWRPEAHPNHFYIGAEKRDTGGWQKLDDEIDGQVACLFPELESIVRLLPQVGDYMCMRKRQVASRRYSDYVRIKTGRSTIDRIKERAGLPPHVGLAAFRHGGLTELGDAGVPDTLAKARSLHKQRSTLDRYIHSTEEQAVEAQRIRLAYRNAK